MESYKPKNILDNQDLPYSELMILSGNICPYCGKESERINSEVVYGRDYGDLMICFDCDAYVGIHHNSDIAKGRLANKALRELKKEAHKYFDYLWTRKMRINQISKHESRTGAYLWLSKKMDIKIDYCHIGMFDESKTKEVINLCKPYYK